MKETITGQKAEFRSAIRTRRMIWDAYTQLLKEKGLSRITVTDIVTRANLNRATFYAHYPDVRDVTEEIENELIAKTLEVLEQFRYTQLFPQSGPASATLRAGSSIFTGSGSAAIWTVCSMILRWRSASCCI